MMSGIKREFIHLKRAWYAESALKGTPYQDEVMMLVSREGNLLGEVAIRWGEFGPFFKAFGDAFPALGHLADVYTKVIALDDEDFTPDQYCMVLVECGFTDVTPVEKDPITP